MLRDADTENVAVIRVYAQSYGGFVSSHVLAADGSDNDSVQCAVAVSPITDWRYLGMTSTVFTPFVSITAAYKFLSS